MEGFRLNKIKYEIDFNDVDFQEEDCIAEYYETYKEIKKALSIDKEGYNLYLIDDFSKDKLKNIIHFINKEFKNVNLEDICYVIKENIKKPTPIILSWGNGIILKKALKDIQDKYWNLASEFYNSSKNEKKEQFLEEIEDMKSDLLEKIIETSKDKGFDIKLSKSGIVFEPLKEDGEQMTEKEFELLSREKRGKILVKISELKKEAEHLLEVLHDKEEKLLEGIKKIFKEYLNENMKDIKAYYDNLLKEERQATEYLNYVYSKIEMDLVESYSEDYDFEEEDIAEIIYKYGVSIILDNRDTECMPCIYEEDPNLENLLGAIEYENKNGNYVTDINMIKPGSMLRANGGCLILRANKLLTNAASYYYFKKTIMSGKVDMNYSKGYLEVLALSGMQPEPIKIKEKVILIGDFETYDILYNHDEDFRKIFKIRGQYDPIVNINKKSKSSLISSIDDICKKNNLKPVKEGGIFEIAKALSRKAEDRRKFYFKLEELEKILVMANNRAVEENKDFIDGEEVVSGFYKEDMLEDKIIEEFKDGKIYMNLKGNAIGEINGLTVLDAGYLSFGKPVKITCNCYNGSGNIIDVQKDSNLSGKIHNKAINILKGYINDTFGRYSRLPVDFHISFEQVYGKIDGDSASVAEVISIISAISRIGIKRNIAVTGSINQKGEVQPIGGVNEKIEGFFNVCKNLDTVKNKGVAIPYSNRDNLVLNREVEEEVENGNFRIYLMKTVEDAVEIFMCNEKVTCKDVFEEADRELKKYYRRK
ncbi:ATP-dependent protease [Clostridium tetani]|uniref:AAA family ATPase n=1 Tax=Clostridium tetani TaxID=1513 RepID=UPI00100A562A|nr:AAA family ATPase [Clostridium tetani]RXI45957.1 ATP-dependent protease [Clostridium tetani]RXM61349.1 ATP-dependent protease [Clostridium tetani]RXM70174.1 ATP-dependent protease [Clostridium tetani]